MSPARHSLIDRLRTRGRAIRGRWQLRRAVRSGAPLRIVVGSGGYTTPGWVATDIEYLNLLRPADWATYFAPNSLTAILAEHVWEHLTPNDGLIAAQTCCAFLRPGGYLRIAVPDGWHPDPGYLDCVRIGGTGAGADDHKVLYTCDTLSRLLREAGFVVEPLEYFDPNGQFHGTDWKSADGMIRRSARFDRRNQNGALAYTSLIVDARKPPSKSAS